MSGSEPRSGRSGWGSSLFGRRDRDAALRHRAAADRAIAEAQGDAAVLERILDAIDQGAVLVDAAGEPLLANRAAREILGIGPRRTSPAFAAVGLAGLAARARHSGEAVAEERELHVPNRRRLSIRVVPFGDDAALALIADVTQTHYSEQVRRDFVANVSHELKTPISGIALLAEQLTDAIREDPDAAERFAERIHLETGRLARLVVDLLDLSRIESEMPLAVADTPAGVIVDDALARVSGFAAAKGTEIVVERASNPAVRADLAAATTALANLVDNAVRYAPAGTSVRVTVTASAAEVSFAVADDGPGIPTEELGRIFERFYRVDKARARATGGTGLGLAIVKHVAERHGGRVEAASEFGRGSRFTLVLPAGGGA